MHKLLRRQTWTCARCLRKQQRIQARTQSTAAVPTAATRGTYYPPLSHTKDNSVLRNVFDSQSFWRDFSQNTSTLSRRSGLIGNKHLTAPKGFQAFAESAI